MSDLNKTIRSKKEFFGKTGKMGTYTAITAVFLLAALIIVNLIVSALPNTFTKFDTSSNKIYTLSSSTKEFISDVDRDVTLYYVCSGDENTTIRTFLDRYTAENGKIKVKTVDPVKDPEFLGKYSADGCSNYSVIAVSGDRYKLVDFADLFYYYNENAGKMDAATYQQYMAYYGDYFIQQYGTFNEFFTGDASVTGAIEYVLAEKVPTIYAINGHNESELSEAISVNLSYSGIVVKSCNIALDEIPADCDVILINAPGSDLSAGEAEKLSAFFDNGGKVFLFTAPGCEKFANLSSFTNHCGMSAAAGTVSEGDSGMHYPRYDQVLLPTVNGEHEATSLYAGQYAGQYPAVIGYAHGIKTVGAEGVTVTPLLETSEKAFTTEDGTAAKYAVAAAAEKGDGKLVWVASAEMLTDTFLSVSQYGNFYCFFIMLNWMQTGFRTSLPDIDAIDLTEPLLSVDGGSANIWGTILIIIIPLAVMIGGLVYWLMRRRK